jgi:hypothetical protein
MVRTFDIESVGRGRFGLRTACLIVGGAAFLAPQPATAFAQENDAPPTLGASTEPVSPSMTISGFRELAWGTSEAEIVRTYGEPFERRDLESGMRLLAYRSSLIGQPSVVLLGLLEDDGLVKAQEVIDVADGDACIETIRDIHHEIDLQYPLIRPREQARNNTSDVICDAAPRGQAYWHRQWIDAETGSMVTVSLSSGSEHVDLIYESGRFRDWVDPGADRTVELLEDEGAPAEDVLEAAP